MKRIGIVTLYGEYNIGNKLQNYAMQELIRDEGCEAETLVNRAIPGPRYSWKGWLVVFLGFPRQASRSRRMALRRIGKFREFSNRMLTCDSEFTREDLKRELQSRYDGFVVGSDQVWNGFKGNKECIDYYFLAFAPKEKRICYAPSFGFDREPTGMAGIYADGLNGFRRLSCREESGRELIRRLTGRDAELLCDPTIAIERERWDGMAQRPKAELPEKWLLVYFLGEMDGDERARIQRIAKERGLTVLRIYDIDTPEYYFVTPDEFIYLVQHASYVCTDSFHGCVFSILYHRSFTAFRRSGEDGAKMQGRIDSLLQEYGLTDRLDRAGDPAESIDWEAVERELLRQRAKGKAYLREELERLDGR